MTDSITTKRATLLTDRICEQRVAKRVNAGYFSHAVGVRFVVDVTEAEVAAARFRPTWTRSFRFLGKMGRKWSSTMDDGPRGQFYNHNALKSSGTSPNFHNTVALRKSPVAGSPVRLLVAKVTLPGQPAREASEQSGPGCKAFAGNAPPWEGHLVAHSHTRKWLRF
jgi:hypothetical protein